MALLSVIAPLGVAVRRTRRILFEPFQLRKWLKLGLCAFLMGSGPLAPFTGTTDLSDRGGSGEPSLQPDQILAWIQEHLGLILTGTVVVLVIGCLLMLLATWLSSRARFMLLDGVIHNRADLAASWRRYRREGNALFRFRVVVGVIALALLALIVAVPLTVSLADLLAGVISLRVVAAGLAATLLLLVWILAMELIAVLLLDFVAPVMLLRHLPVLPAWRIVLVSLVRSQPMGIALYLLSRVLLNGAIGTLAMLAVVLSCCLALVPYLGSVLVLPLTLFQISYPLAYLEQLGPQWAVFAPERSAPAQA